MTAHHHTEHCGLGSEGACVSTERARAGSDFFFKAFGLIRFYLLRLRYCRRGVFHGPGLVGSRCRITVTKSGTLELGSRVVLADDAELKSAGTLRLGNCVGINRYSRIMAVDSITIGDWVTLAQFVTILDHTYNIVKNDQGAMRLSGYKTAPVKIGSNIWIGDKVTILKGVTIGDNVVIGAHSLVNRDVPSNCIVAGNPARVVRQL
jgi:hypothetical protein